MPHCSKKILPPITFLLAFLSSCEYGNHSHIIFYHESSLSRIDFFIKRECQKQDKASQENAQKIRDLEENYRKKLLKEPQKACWFFLYGRLLGLMKRPEESLLFFQYALQKDPEFLWAYYGYGVYFLKKERFFQASIYFQKCLNINFSFIPALMGMAKVNIKTDAARSLYYIYRAVRLAPKDVSLHQNLANALLLAKKPQAALKSLQKAILLEPNNVEILNSLAPLLIKLKKHQKAIVVVEKLYKLQKNNKSKRILKKLKRLLLFLKQKTAK